MVVVSQNPNAVGNLQPIEDPSIWSQVPWGTILTITGIALLIALIGGLIFWGAYTIYKKINEERRKKTDLEFFKFKLDEKMCVINSNKKYVWRTWYTLWFGKKRAKIYALTELGRKMVGEYNGECVKKEGFYLLSLYQKYSFFHREIDLVVFPYDYSKSMIRHNDDFTIDLVCEGIDEVMSSEYYSIPVISNHLQNQREDRFNDFSNLVLEKYFRLYMYRDVIKNNISEFRENIKDATEMNPNVQYGRKTQSSLDNNKPPM